MAKVLMGKMVVTRGADEALRRSGENSSTFFARHEQGKWGRVCEEDAEQNEQMAELGGMVMSVFNLCDGTVIWVITDPRGEGGVPKATTILLPEEY